MRGFIVGTVATAIAFFILTRVLPQYIDITLPTYDGELIGLLALAVVFGIVNGLIGPVIKTAALPISFQTMGLFGFVVNGVLLLVTAAVADAVGLKFVVGDFPPDLTADSIVAAIIGAVILGIVNSLTHAAAP